MKFIPSELLLAYPEWKALSDERRSTLRPSERAWLCEWEAYDLATSPRDDNERRWIRLGHHLGYFAAACHAAERP